MSRLNYTLPDEYHGRELEGYVEKVDYYLNSNIRIWHNVQNEGYALHQHNAIEILVPIENVYTIIVNNNTYHLEPGDILFIPGLTLHEIIKPDWGERFFFMFNMDPLTNFHDYSALEPVLLDPCLLTKRTNTGIYEHIYSRLMEISNLYFSPGVTFREYSIYANLIDILTTIGREHYDTIFAGTDNTAEKSYDYYQKFNSLLAYINDHYGEQLTLEKMADYTGFSKYHFTRLFKQHTNSTFYDYLSRKRIQAAQTLLTTGASITSIAFQTGFNNSTSFTRCFKKYTNYSPSEYRTKFIEDVPGNVPVF